MGEKKENCMGKLINIFPLKRETTRFLNIFLIYFTHYLFKNIFERKKFFFSSFFKKIYPYPLLHLHSLQFAVYIKCM